MERDVQREMYAYLMASYLGILVLFAESGNAEYFLMALALFDQYPDANTNIVAPALKSLPIIDPLRKEFYKLFPHNDLERVSRLFLSP